jgi:hypothetical protein
MHLLDPNILEAARGSSPVVSGTGLVIGLLLWFFGGRSHRFWLALIMTLAAGLLGLSFGPAYGMQPLVAGLLLAVAVGALALSLVRILVFAAGGLAGLWVVLALAWDEPLVGFLVGGLTGVLLYRFWITVLASLAGTLLLAHSALCLVDRPGKFDAAAWATKNAPLLDWGCAAFAVVGVLVQFLLERRRRRRRAERAQAAQAPAFSSSAPPPAPPAPPRAPWWKKWQPRSGPRRAA